MTTFLAQKDIISYVGALCCQTDGNGMCWREADVLALPIQRAEMYIDYLQNRWRNEAAQKRSGSRGR